MEFFILVFGPFALTGLAVLVLEVLKPYLSYSLTDVLLLAVIFTLWFLAWEIMYIDRAWGQAVARWSLGEGRDRKKIVDLLEKLVCLLNDKSL